MPLISAFYGVLVRMYFFDAERHRTPHIQLDAAWQMAVNGFRPGKIDPLQ